MGSGDEQQDLQGVIIDLDGFFYRNDVDWKVVHPSIGVLGSMIRMEEGCRLFFAIREKDPTARFTDYFRIEKTRMSHNEPDLVDNTLPESLIVKTAINHRFRGRELHLLSAFPFGMERDYLNELFETGKQFPLEQNPFDRITTFVLTGAERTNRQKIEALELLLKRTETAGDAEKQNERFETQPEERPSPLLFNRIFYYHHDPEMLPLLNECVKQNATTFEEGRNALIHFYIRRDE